MDETNERPSRERLGVVMVAKQSPHTKPMMQIMEARVRARLYCDCVWNIPGRLSSWSVSTMTEKTTSGGTVRRALTRSAIG